MFREDLKKNTPTESLDRNKLPEQSQKATLAVDKNRAEAATQKPVVIAESSPDRQRDRVKLADQTTAEQALNAAEMNRLMKDQINELRQPAAEEKTTSRRKKSASESREKVTKRAKRADNAAQIFRVGHKANQSLVVEEQHDTNPSSSSRRVNLEEPIKLETAPGDTTYYPPAEDILPVAQEVFSVFDEETPPLAPQPNAQASTQVSEAVSQDQSGHDRLFDFQELEPSIDEIEPYATDGRPLKIFYEGEEPLVAKEALPHSTDLAEAGILPRYEAIFDYEVMDTFEQLLELVYGELGKIHTPELEQHAELIDDQVILINPETPESIEPNAFEEFVASIAKPEVIPDLGTIMTSANEQTLEETLMQLSLYLTETSPDSENPPVIQKTLKDLAELLSRSSSDNATEEKKMVITPELAQQLLTLLRAVGYDNPQEVLLAFVKQHDFEFLLQAIRYLSQLCNDDDRKELLYKQATITASKSDESLTARLGGAILSLMTRFKIPEVAVSD